MSKREDYFKKLEEMKKTQDEKKEPARARKTIEGILNQEVDKPDFKKMAQELQERRDREMIGANEDFIKDTLYIQKDLYTAFNALCLKRGDKKKFVNEAITDFVQKKYNELKKR